MDCPSVPNRWSFSCKRKSPTGFSQKTGKNRGFRFFARTRAGVSSSSRKFRRDASGPRRRSTVRRSGFSPNRPSIRVRTNGFSKRFDPDFRRPERRPFPIFPPAWEFPKVRSSRFFANSDSAKTNAPKGFLSERGGAFPNVFRPKGFPREFPSAWRRIPGFPR